MTECLSKIKNFIAIEEREKQLVFTFTEASLRILKKYLFVLNEEIAESIRDIMLYSGTYKNLNSLDSIEGLLMHAEEEAYCRLFLREYFPNLLLRGHIYSQSSHCFEIEQITEHCSKTPCMMCLRRAAS